MTDHPLDRAVWNSLSTRQADLCLVRGVARRMKADFGVFAGIPDMAEASLADLAALARAHGPLALLQPETTPPLPGVAAEATPGVQMVALSPAPPVPHAFDLQPLTDADGPEMLALATLTRPGPFFSRTHQLGAFVGVREGGRLVAMAGERLRLPGYTEVSGVCTDPDHRGRGLADALVRAIAAGIVARGETPFLHSYADNAGAIRLYETLGFRLRREVMATLLAPIDPDAGAEVTPLHF